MFFSSGPKTSHLVGPCEQHITHEKNVLGAGYKVYVISRRPNIDIVFFSLGYRFSIRIAIFYSIIVSNDTISVVF